MGNAFSHFTQSKSAVGRRDYLKGAAGEGGQGYASMSIAFKNLSHFSTLHCVGAPQGTIPFLDDATAILTRFPESNGDLLHHYTIFPV